MTTATLDRPFTAFDHENAFYLSCPPQRLGKLLAQYEAFKAVVGLPGAIVECGVFKGASLARLAMFRALLSSPWAHEIIGFDTFKDFAPADSARDFELRDAVVANAGSACVSTDELYTYLAEKRCEENVTLVPGDINVTVPNLAASRPELRIALLNLDVDFYEPAKVVLEHLWPRVVPGGIVLLDDYGTFDGETRAAEEFFGDQLRVEKYPFAYSPSFMVKR